MSKQPLVLQPFTTSVLSYLNYKVSFSLPVTLREAKYNDLMRHNCPKFDGKSVYDDIRFGFKQIFDNSGSYYGQRLSCHAEVSALIL